MLGSLSSWSRFLRILPGALALWLFCPALGAAPDSGGWFDDPVEAAPEGSGSSSRTADERPSLAPSPLLEREKPPPDEAAVADSDPRALSDFKPALDPHGTWVQHPRYGTVWVPSRELVGADFAPYLSDGHWALDTWGRWVWVSDYSFGRIVFHYGRWAWIAGTGWGWVPGYRYAPAWVHWRVPAGSWSYVGWAPMGPDYVWLGGTAVSFGYGAPIPWVFCPSSSVFHRHVRHHVVRDRVLMRRIVASTRHYAPAPRRSSASSVRLRSRSLSGPPLTSARVPAHAVPRERVQSPRVIEGPRERRYVPSPSFNQDRFVPRSASPRSPGRQELRTLPAPKGAVRDSRVRRAPAPGVERARRFERQSKDVFEGPERVRSRAPVRVDRARPREPVRRGFSEPRRAPAPRRFVAPAAPRGDLERRALPRRRR